MQKELVGCQSGRGLGASGHECRNARNTYRNLTRASSTGETVKRAEEPIDFICNQGQGGTNEMI